MAPQGLVFSGTPEIRLKREAFADYPHAALVCPPSFVRHFE
jgi:hypothetical protein